MQLERVQGQCKPLLRIPPPRTEAHTWAWAGGRVRLPAAALPRGAHRKSSSCGVPGPGKEVGYAERRAPDQLGAHAAWGFPPPSDHFLLRLGSTL